MANVNLLSVIGLLALTITVFPVSLWVFNRGQRLLWLDSLLHPLVTGSIFITLVLWLLQIDYADYQKANWPLIKLLGPATVALAIPLHNEFHHIQKMAKPLLITLVVGTLFSIVIALICAWLMGGSPETLLAVSTKTVTTPIALGIAEKILAEPGLVAGIVIFTGVVGGIAAVPLFQLLGITDDRIKGFALGINAHGVGTAKAFEISPRCGAFSSLAMSLTGALVALFLPWIILTL